MGKQISNLNFVIVDCQTTAATPAQGHLIELGWMILRGAPRLTAENSHGRSRLISLPDGAPLPSQVSKITGISAEDLSNAQGEREVWQQLLQDISSHCAEPEVFFVAHYARFEEKFLGDLMARFGMGDFRWRFICTHEIAKRLMPNLPRLSLRALSGHLGFRLPESKRACDHVLATAHIWHCLVQTLKAEQGIDDLESLEEFQGQPLPRRGPRKTYLVPREKRQSLPNNPGVYRFVDTGGGILYIGKAANLRTRVGSYFTARRRQGEHILEMITQANDVLWEPTETRLEAALAEADLIKQHDPPYNRVLRDSNGAHLAFFSPDFESHRYQFGPSHSAGPFPPNSVTEQFSLIAHHLGGMNKPNTGPKCLPLEGLRPIPEDAMRAGLGGLRAVLFGDRPVSARTLLALGMILDAHRRQRKKEKQEAAEKATVVEKTKEYEWTGTRVAHAILGLVGNMGASWSRSILLRFLSNSVILWQQRRQAKESSRSGTAGWRRLEISRSEIISQGTCSGEEGVYGNPVGRQGSFAAETPPRWNQRGKQFTLTGYDRLRVLEAELRRLAAEKRALHVMFSPQASWHTQQLRRLFGGG